MKKIIGIVLIVIFISAMGIYIDSGVSSDVVVAIGRLLPNLLVGGLGLYLLFGKSKKKTNN